MDKMTGKPINYYKKFPVEVAIYNDDFTNNKVSVFYYEDPQIIQDIDSKEAEALHLTESSKAILKDSLVDSIPCNLDTFIPIPVDGTEIERHLDEINTYANYTCKFEVNDNVKVTNGVFTKFPLNNTVHNLFLCQ
jgi:transcription antitermination factor NusG